MKTCEEYVLQQLKKAEQLLTKAENRIKELESTEVIENSKEDMQCIYIGDKPNYYYSVETEGAYNYNEILKDNNLTPKFVEECLTDDKKIKQLCDLSKKGSWRGKIGEVNRRIYNYLFETRNGKHIVILSDNSTYMMDIDKNNCGNFLNEKNAIEYRNKKVKENIEWYLKNYKDKFEEEK